MNYDHAYHAGNFADVVKHATIVRIVDYLKRKDQAFRIIDTHAGSGVYDLSSERAQKTGEWLTGIGRVLEADFRPDATALLAPYLDSVRAFNPDGGLTHYPGSPAIMRHLLRKQDRMLAIELEPKAHLALSARFANDYQARVLALDGWLALGAHVPPKEKRGFVIVDPPFEIDNEFGRIVDGLKRAHARWPGGVYAFWYPAKDFAAIERFRKALKATGISKILDSWLTIRSAGDQPRLDGTGMIVVNPPYTLEQELKVMLPALCEVLKTDDGAKWSVDWLTGETSSG